MITVHKHDVRMVLTSPTLKELSAAVAAACKAANGKNRKYLITPPRTLAKCLTAPEGLIQVFGGKYRSPSGLLNKESSLGIAWHSSCRKKTVLIVSRRDHARSNAFGAYQDMRKLTPKEIVLLFPKGKLRCGIRYHKTSAEIAAKHPQIAKSARKLPDNAPGKFYVSDGCSDCGNCRELASDHFTRNDNGGYSFVSKQPATPEEEARCEKAMDFCPIDEVGNDGDT